jgi:hypothetical protein
MHGRVEQANETEVGKDWLYIRGQRLAKLYGLGLGP